jgi:hypothetical protein
LYPAPCAAVQLQGVDEALVLLLGPLLPLLGDRVRLARLVDRATKLGDETRTTHKTAEEFRSGAAALSALWSYLGYAVFFQQLHVVGAQLILAMIRGVFVGGHRVLLQGWSTEKRRISIT